MRSVLEAQFYLLFTVPGSSCSQARIKPRANWALAQGTGPAGGHLEAKSCQNAEHLTEHRLSFFYVLHK